MASDADWISPARRELVRLRADSSGWGYRPGTEPYVEPTVLGCLALLATESEPPSQQTMSLVTKSARWLATLQQRDGSLGLCSSLDIPRWPTAYALLQWSALTSTKSWRERAVAWLLGRAGVTFKKVPGSPIGHDTTIAGWPWVADTHSWVEPTAIALLALRREGLASNDRVREGIRMLRNRAISTGGWNYGNNTVFGNTLRPRPAPTGLALLALAGLNPSPNIEPAIAYLLRVLPTIRSAQSQCWGLLGLTAWKRRPPEAGFWLSQVYEQSLKRSDPAPQLAYLLLGAGAGALRLFGLAP